MGGDSTVWNPLSSLTSLSCAKGRPKETLQEEVSEAIEKKITIKEALMGDSPVQEDTKQAQLLGWLGLLLGAPIGGLLLMISFSTVGFFGSLYTLAVAMRAACYTSRLGCPSKLIAFIVLPILPAAIFPLIPIFGVSTGVVWGAATGYFFAAHGESPVPKFFAVTSWYGRKIGDLVTLLKAEAPAVKDEEMV